MSASRLRAAGLAVAATIGLSACTTLGPYGGLGYGGGYGGYGGYDPYYDDYRYGSGYGYGYGYPGYATYGYNGYGSPYGWYDGLYYPGTGYYVYRDGKRHRWSESQRRYWERLRERRQQNQVNNGTVTTAPGTVQQRSVWRQRAENRRARSVGDGDTVRRSRSDWGSSSSSSSDGTSAGESRRGWGGLRGQVRSRRGD